jgi:hypothetical protein
MVIVGALAGCDYGDPSATVGDMVSSLNSANIEKMIDTFEPDMRSVYEGSAGVASGILKGFTGMDINIQDVGKMLPALTEMFGGAAGAPVKPTWKILEMKWTMDSTHTYALVMAHIQSTSPGENDQIVTQVDWVPFLLKRIDSKWKILGMQQSIQDALDAWPEASAELKKMGMTVDPQSGGTPTLGTGQKVP